jgi:CRP/FNR family transcriptional regulator, nitrogen oxide reductase regulator
VGVSQAVRYERAPARDARTAAATSNRPHRGIQNAAIFEGLSPEELKLVVNRASLQVVPKGVFLFRQGEAASKMFLLESGRVRLHENTTDGHELLIRLVRPGEVFGDKAAVAGANYGASAESDTPVRTYGWTTAAFAALLQEVPRLAVNLFTIATRYLHYSRERYRMLATAPVERRIRWALTELARSFGFTHGNTRVITGRALQKDIADLGITTIYSVSRVLRGYEQRRMLTRKRGRIVLFRRFQTIFP